MTKASYTLVQLQQGSSEWLAWRHCGIGSSDAPIIMGENKWKSVEALLTYKQGPAIDTAPKEDVESGLRIEPEARSKYILRTGIKVEPACLQSNEYEWMRASVDGISIGEHAAVEIKCGESTYQKTLQHQTAPRALYPQLQHILAVTGFDFVDLWCYLPQRQGVLVSIERNQGYIEKLIRAEYAFWSSLQKNQSLQRK